MCRLTEKMGDLYGVAGCGKKCKYNYKFCEKMDECPTIDEIIEKLGKYEDLYEKT